MQRPRLGCVPPVTGKREVHPHAAKRRLVGRDRAPIMATICRNCVAGNLGKIVIVPRKSALLIAAIAGCAALTPLCADAQWWSRAPADFEECADKAEKAASKEERTSQ